ncbi:mitochondrial intermediate peptidase [Aspergillus clavatus NRRL 1]|uniref:Mitochondrial intermediate peptidase n=1 Tax=Aspergillus clavatus (strain ATCC 1007 / CBS 513.65 / DSM 816 / NCTC 3887 / NRRL 1 / QM 1276 / 107) TaxID=344612 RepID=PMIP_ASPCL|nr:metallopeptidase Mip1 [Aspergillus clavatus NRRL 1]A1CTP5.1 RecName: Full=Mitochondrial intermediate peptidase; Short=MIP; AltName: Full=Octapeptidyl aminopeptidase; Flags: Precursor [Aspergillus clavatus NRRL 1]EAW06682.1 metallopeptidase Mip1 [Aspergillus clavatus NRRL 1]
MKPQLLTPLRRRPWTCRQCLQRLQRLQQQTRRSFETAASPAPGHTQVDYIPADASQSKKVDDETIRRVFDSQHFWREFSQRRSTQSKPTGLVQNQYLTSPDGFRTFANVSLQKCQAIVSKVLAASTLEEYRTMARDLDRLSDLLCRVIDLSDFIRVIHPDPRVQEAATQAYALMFEYMNVLNTTTGLNDQLKKAVANPEVASHWTEEEKIVAQILIKDFSNSAILMPPQERQRFVNLSNDISQLGSSFVNSPEPAKSQVVVNANSLRGLDPMLVQQIKRWNRTASVPTTGMIPRLALRSVHDESVRREVYLASRTSSARQLHRLEELLLKRAELAKLSGYSSFGHMTLSDKMAKSPEAVSNFLTSLVDSNRTLVREELLQLRNMKGSPLQPWDHAYYVHKRVMQYSQSRRSRELSAVPEFFSLGTVMQGLSRLFDRLYGVRLVPQEAAPGETWNPDVRRLDVVDEADRHIAVIYCDLFSRPNKHPNPAHFTLRCSREISATEVAECASLDQSSHPNDGMATAVDPTTKTLRQLPTIALVCDFAEPAAHGGRPSLLSEHSVRTLFHEMGHALHSILGQTRLQSISGTRCATDFAELPSVLMEHFATAPSVLSLYARHWETDEPLSERMIQSMERDRTAHGSIYGAVENEAQILMALVDQEYHSRPADGGRIDSTALYHEVAQRHSSLPDPAETAPPTSWQGFFGHLYGYGATYYSYIFDRAIANKLWADVFGAGRAAVDRAAGERYKTEVLRWGGGRNGWQCVAGVLGPSNASNADGRLVEGGDEAMREVGRWGLGRDGVSG